MSGEYYELEDLIRLLKKSKSTIIRDANAGKIPSEGEKRNRRYPKEAIDAIVEIEENKRRKSAKAELIFSSSTPHDLWQEVTIGRNLYGEDDIVPYKTLLEWNEINDEMCKSLKYKNRVVGYSSLMPLEEGVIIALLNDKIRERDIPYDAIKQWNEPELSIYVCSMTIKPTDNPTRDSERAGIIIKNTIKWALSLDRQFHIKNWYGIGATKEGQRLFEELGFHEITSLDDGKRKGYVLESSIKVAHLIQRINNREN